jgi:Xaa-Pro aminopeptidase
MVPIHKEFAQRRQQLLSQLEPNSIALVYAAPECLRNGDSHYPYRQDSSFYYLTGLNEPEAVAVFIPGRKQGEFLLFNRKRDPAMELWTGKRTGQEGARKIYGADQSFAIEQLDEQLPLLFENHKRLYYPIGQSMQFNSKILNWVKRTQAKVRSGTVVPSEFFNIEEIIHEMRLRKSPHELELMRKAADITAKAHIKAMQICRPGMMEYELEAELQAEFCRNGARQPAYNHIVGSGEMTCILHYNDNDKRIEAGDLVLIDAGAEFQGYAADVTRTFPANGKFSEPQKAVYEIVLAAQLAAIAKVRPGATWKDLQDASNRVVTEGLLHLGLLKGKLESLIEKNAFQRFYMHRVSHWLGLDVHDVGSYKINGQWRSLEPGMVLTVEPGIYIASHSKDVNPKWWNIGVRIEDDVLVTESGSEVLSAKAPKTVDEIEKVMFSPRPLVGEGEPAGRG